MYSLQAAAASRPVRIELCTARERKWTTRSNVQSSSGNDYVDGSHLCITARTKQGCASLLSATAGSPP